MFTPSLFNTMMTYGNGGFAVEMPLRNKTAAEVFVNHLQVFSSFTGPSSPSRVWSSHAPLFYEHVALSPHLCIPSFSASCIGIVTNNSWFLCFVPWLAGGSCTIQSGGWIDQATRAVVVTFNFFNPTHSLFTVFRTMIEISPTRFMETSCVMFL